MKNSILLLTSVLLGMVYQETFPQSTVYGSFWVPKNCSYEVSIRNHTKQEAYDIHIILEKFATFQQQREWYFNKGTMAMTKNHNTITRDALWNKGKPVEYETLKKYKNDKKEFAMAAHFNLKGNDPVKPGTKGWFKFDLTIFADTITEKTLLEGKYWWTDARGKGLGDIMPINNPKDINHYIQTEYIKIPANPKVKKSSAGCSLNEDDTIEYALETFLWHREEIINLDHFEGIIDPGEIIEHEFDVDQGEHGDSIITNWTFTNMLSEETWEESLKHEIVKGSIFTEGDTVYWSEGEMDSTYLSFLGGAGVQVRSPEMPNFELEGQEEEFYLATFQFPDEFETHDMFNLSFIRTGRGIPMIKGQQGGLPEVDTAACVVRHGDFRPSISWASGDGLFDPVDDTIVFPITVIRVDEDTDWVYTQIFGENMTDTAWFHHEMSGLTNELSLPVDFPQGELDDIDSLYVVVTSALAPSSPDTMMAYIIHSQGIDDFMVNKQFDITCYPNPFSDEVVLEYNLTSYEKVKVEIYHWNGQLLEKTIDQYQEAGEHKVTWNSSSCAPGVYIYRITIGQFRMSGKIAKIE